MGLSHHAILNANPDVHVAAVCDSSGFLLSLLRKYTGIRTYSSLDKMLDETDLDAVVVATPSSLHAGMTRAVLARDLHVFCEKPFCLVDEEGAELASMARERGLVTQVGYHNRFVAAFREVKQLLDQQAIGQVTHILGEAYGPVVLRPKGTTWRSKSTEGGGCLYDYAAHPINLVNWYLGQPIGVGGTVLNRVFSREIDDEVSSTLYFERDANAQISVSWSDESVRKMTTRVTIWGTQGRIFADRQECQVFCREDPGIPGYAQGWNIRYTTELTDPVDFYLRGEEYTAQLDAFLARVAAREVAGENSFSSAIETDQSISMMIADAAAGPATRKQAVATEGAPASVSPRSGRRRGAARIADQVRQSLTRLRNSVEGRRAR
jgi:predicted dehydrogenase